MARPSILYPLSSILSDRRLGDFVLTTTAALFTVVLLTLGYQAAWPLSVDIGERDQRFVSQVAPDDPARGFHAVERFGDTPMRWTAGDATLALPHAPGGAPSILALALLNSRPPGQPDPHVDLSADGRRLGGFGVPRAAGGPRIYRVLLPGATRLGWATRIDIRSDTITLPDDPRPLGVVLDRAALAPLGGVVLLPSLWLLVCAAAIGALGYALPRSIGISRGAAWPTAALLAALVAAGIAARPLEVLPFVQRIAALLGLGCLGIWVARLLAPPIPTTDHRPPADENKEQGTKNKIPPTVSPSSILHPPSSDSPPLLLSPAPRLSIRGADLPIYLAVAGWLGPLFQLVMTADGAASVRPPPATTAIGGWLALLLLGMGGWYLLRGRGAGSGRQAMITRWSLLLLAAAAAAHLGTMISFAFSRQAADFWIFFKGAREWARGAPLYDLGALRTDFYGHVFKVPPFFALLLQPFVFQDGERVLFYYRVLDTLMIGATALAWLRMWGLRVVSVAAAAVLILLNFRPLADTMQFGQADLVLLFSLTLALWALREERDILAGALVALGALLKIYPVLLLAFFVVKGRWRALAGFGLGLLALSALSIAVMGWEVHRIYLAEVLPVSGGPTAWVENQAVAGFLARFAAPPTSAVVLHNQAVRLLANAVAAALGLLACYLALRPAHPKTTAYALQYSQFLLLMLLAAPAAWMHYQALLFVPFAALLLHLRDREVGLGRAAALAAGFGLIAYGNQWSYYDGTVMGALTVAGISYKFYGMLLLGGVLTSVLWAERVEVRLDQVSRSWRGIRLMMGGR